jgi:hypothetical protein
MANKFTRREFIKASSLSAAGVSVLSLRPWAYASGFASAKSLVVITKDPLCYANNTVNQTKLQDMMDHTIMELTGVMDKVKAYEALFPVLTTKTKIAIKYNQARADITRTKVINALKQGLTSMLNGTFPASNITLVGDDGGTGGTSEGFKIGSNSYNVKTTYANCDYFINLPTSCAVDVNAGVSLSFKAMVVATAGASISSMHGYFQSSTTPVLSLICSQPTLRKKQALVLQDAISITAVGNQVAAGNTLIASKDMVAADYQGIMLMKATGLNATNASNGLVVCQLAAAAPYSIGTNVEANMDVRHLSPPYSTRILSSGTPLSYIPEVEVKTGRSSTVFNFRYGENRRAILSVFAMNGARVWSEQGRAPGITWAHTDGYGKKVLAGTYLFTLQIGEITARGTVTIGM